MPGPLVVTPHLLIAEDQLSLRFSRSSGPGGQGVNTSDSRVELSFDVQRSPALTEFLRARVLERLGRRLVDGVITVAASEHRSQLRNREAAEARMAILLAEAVAPPARQRRATAPSRASVQRRLDSKRRRSRVKRTRSNTED